MNEVYTMSSVIDSNARNEINKLRQKIKRIYTQLNALIVRDTTRASDSINPSGSVAVGPDEDAIHYNVADEIQGVLTNVTPAAADEFLIEDASDSNNKKAVLFSAIESTLNHDSLAGFDSNEHFTMLDEDDMSSDSATQAATQQSIKAYVDGQTHSDTQLTQEQVEDFAGAMIATGGTKTGIAVTYQDSTNDMDFVVDHDAANNFSADEHFTMLDEDDMASDSDTKAATQQSIKAYIDGKFMIGSANADYRNCMLMGASAQNTYPTSQNISFGNDTADDGAWTFKLPHPTTLDGLSLYVEEVRIILVDADTSDYISRVRVYGTTSSGFTEVYDHNGNLQTAGVLDSDGVDMTDYSTADDMSSYYGVAVHINFVSTTRTQLDIAEVQLKIYYA